MKPRFNPFLRSASSPASLLSRNFRPTSGSIALAVAAGLGLTANQSAQAASVARTWSTTPTDLNWSTANNWGGTAPLFSDTLSFGTSPITALTVDTANYGTSATNNSTAYLNGITFTSGASAYTMTLSNPLSFANSGTIGIVVNSGVSNDETFTGGTIYLGIGTSSSSVQFINNGTGKLIINSALAGGASGTANDAAVVSGTGDVQFNGNITNGNATSMIVTKNGTNTLTLSGAANTYTGATTVNSGTLALSSTGTLGGTAVTVANGGTFTQANGSVMSLGTSFDNSGSTTLSGINTYTGATKASYGTLKLDFSGTGVASGATNIVSSSSALTLGSTTGGGTLNITGGSGANSQAFGGLTITAQSSNAFQVVKNTATSLSVSLGALTSRGANSVVDFTLPSSGTITTTATTASVGTNKVLATTSGIAWGTVGGLDWATNSATGVFGSTAGLYNTNSFVSSGDTTVTGSQNPGALFTVNTLRFNSDGASLANTGLSTVTSGGILVTSNAGNSGVTISGGSFKAGGGREMVVINNGLLNFGSNIADSTSGTSALTVTSTLGQYGTSTFSGTNAIGTNLVVTGGNVTFSGANTVGGKVVVTGLGSSLTLSGANNITGATNIGYGATLKLANAKALGDTTVTTGVFLDSNATDYSTLWLANNAAINNLNLSSAIVNGPRNTRVVVDAATSGGYSGNQTLTGLVVGQQVNATFQKGSLTSGTPTITGPTTVTVGFAGAAKTSIINARDVNVTLTNVTGAAPTAGSATIALNLDGTSTGNTVSGVISNSSNGGTTTTTAITGSAGSNTITATSGAGILVGMTLTGTGIAPNSVVTASSGTGANATITLSQQTTGSVSGNGTVLGLDVIALAKGGSGIWSLTGANTYTGITSVQAGTLKLDFANSATTTDLLYNGYVTSGTGVRPTVSIAGGNLLLAGKGGTTNNVQNLSTLQSTASYGGKITLTGGVVGGTNKLQLSTLTLNTFSYLDFVGVDATTNIINSTGSTGGFIGRSTVNGNEFAFVDGSKNIVAATSANYSTGASITNSNVGGTSNSFFLTGGQTRSGTIDFAFKNFKITSTGSNDTFDLGSSSGTLSVAGTSVSSLLYAGGGNSNYNILNGTIRSSNTSAAELQAIVSNGSTLNVSSSTAMSDNGAGALSVSKVGDGTLTVTGGKSFTGIVRVAGGTYSFDTIANGGTASGLGASSNINTNLIISGGTVKYTGSGGSTDRSFQMGANGATFDASGSGALTWSPASSLAYLATVNGSGAGTVSGNQDITFTGSSLFDNTFGSGAVGNLTDNAVGQLTVTKTGVGKWILGGANNYTGGTYINGGTLGVTGTETAGTTGPLGKLGDVVFGGGTLQYSGTNTADYSSRIKRSSSAIAINTNNQAVTFASALDNTNIGGLTKSGAGVLTLNAANTYSGATNITAGTLLVNGIQTNATGAVTVAANATLGGNGTVGGATTISSMGIHSVGAVATGGADGVGKQTFTSTVTYETGSIFEWNLAAAPSETGRGTSYDAVNAASLGSTTGAIFRVVLNGTQDFTSTFWDSDRTWSDIFKTGDAGSNLSIDSIFSGTVQYYNGGGTTLASLGAPTAQGAFTFSGTDLKWSAVPEPTSALVGLLVGAGLLRRRRVA